MSEKAQHISTVRCAASSAGAVQVPHLHRCHERVLVRHLTGEQLTQKNPKAPHICLAIIHLMPVGVADVVAAVAATNTPTCAWLAGWLAGWLVVGMMQRLGAVLGVRRED